MDVDQLRQRVEAGVQEALIPRLLERCQKSHQKRNWKRCPCTYCAEKRKWYNILLFAPHYLSHQQKKDWRNSVIARCRANLSIEAGKVI